MRVAAPLEPVVVREILSCLDAASPEYCVLVASFPVFVPERVPDAPSAIVIPLSCIILPVVRS